MISSISNRLKALPKRIRRRIYRWRHRKSIFLVYTMGKVGTMTFAHFFRFQYPELQSYTVHFLSDYWVKEKIPSLNSFYHANLEMSSAAYKGIASTPDGRLKIITMGRDLVAREISIIFQNWKGLFEIESTGELSADFLKRFLDEKTDDNGMTWFDTDFKPFTGFDIYSVPFDKEKGYAIYKTDKADILFMKTEKINSCVKEAMQEFLGMKMEIPPTANRSENKEGKELYHALVKGYKAPKEKLELIYNSRFMRHFYTDAEIDSFVRKWSRGEFGLADIKTELPTK